VTTPTPPKVLVALRCPHCVGPSEQAEALLVVDGPGVCFRQVPLDEAQPWDVCGRCPKCGRLWCCRLMRPAA
jgi:hypothetical protein